MKNMKKLVGVIALTVALLVSMVIPTFAANITVSGGAAGSEYSAYMLLNATDGGEGKFAYTLNSKYAAVLETATGKTAQADIVAYISALDADGIRAFADTVYVAIADAALEADATTTTGAFADMAQGYYLIAETKDGTDSTDTFSLVMLDTAGQDDITVSTKEGVPSVEKKVEEVNDTTGTSSWGDSADHDIGDVINFTLTGTVSSKYADYKSYYYSFVDTMDAGLTFNKDSVKVYVVNGDDKVDVTTSFVVEETDGGFTATSNLKEIADVTINANTKIVVEYTATLNADAVTGGDGNLNKVYLSYENNPYHEADGDNDPTTPNKPGEPDTPDNPDDDEPDTPGTPDEPANTPEDVVVVFTFDAIVNKVDGEGNAVEGAGFTLYKNIEGTWTAVGEEITGVTTFNFDGLDVGEYKLVESTIPSGYNACADILFEIVATYDTAKDPHELTALEVMNGDTVLSDESETASFTATFENGQISTDVVNTTGSELPSTGGIGTTIFYCVGGALVLAAVVLLITKLALRKRED